MHLAQFLLAAAVLPPPPPPPGELQLEPSLFLAFGTMAKDKSAKKEVVSREYTVNLGKMLHGWYVHLMDGMG